MKLKTVLSMALLGAVLLLTMTSSAPGKVRDRSFLPKYAREFYWEMTPEQLPERVAFRDDGMTFRKVYMDESPKSPLSSVVLYFDTQEGTKLAPKLYEVLLIYPTEDKMKKEAAKLFGPPNTEDGEWVWEKGGHKYMAWTYQSKLIVVKVIPGCEWDE